MTAPRSFLSKLRRRTLAVLLGLALVLALLELGVRFLPIGAPVGVRASVGIHEGRRLVCAHPDLRYGLRPDLAGLRVPNADFDLYHVATTPAGEGAIGFRGAHDEQPFGVVVGDSFAFGFGVEEEEAIPSLLSQRFGVPFANFGVFGHGPQQAKIVARDFAVPRNPRVALWIFYGNDLGDAWRFADWEKHRYGFEAGPAREFHNTHWATYKYYRYLSPFLSSKRERWSSGTVEHVFGYQMFGDLDLEQASIRAGLEILKAELVEFQELCQAGSVIPILVLAPFKEAVYIEEFRAIAERSPRWAVHDEMHGEIAAHADSIGLSTLDLTPVLRDERADQLYFVVDAHLAPRGNEAAARAIGDFIAASLDDLPAGR